MAEDNPQIAPLQLSHIYLRSSRVEMAETFDPTLPGQELLGRYRVASSKVRKRKTSRKDADPVIAYEFLTAFEFVQTPPLDDNVTDDLIREKTLTHTFCELVAQYVPVAEVTDKFLAEWATKQVVFQLWPYFREFCHDASMRMSLPQAPIPLLQINLVSSALEAQVETEE